MKKTITTLFLTTLTIFGFAQDTDLATLSTPVVLNTSEQRKGTIYLKIGVNESEVPKSNEKMLPGLGMGYRAAYGNSAVDVSSDFNRKQVRDENNRKSWNYAYNALKVNYLYYLTSATSNSFYAGAGLAWAGLEDLSKETFVLEDGQTKTTSKKQEFHGIVPNVVLGYEVGRNSAWRTFFQLDISQPAVAAIQNGAFPGPAASFSIGGGF